MKQTTISPKNNHRHAGTAMTIAALAFVSGQLPVRADDVAPKPNAVRVEEVRQIKNGLTALRDTFAKLQSWEFAGAVRVETSNEFMQAYAPVSITDRDQKKLGQYRLRELRSGELWMAHRERLRADGSMVSSETFYTTPESVVHKMVGKGSDATVYPNQGGKHQAVAAYFDSVMLIYSFLSPDWGEGHIPHLDPKILNSTDAWNKALDLVTSTELSPGGATRVVFVRKQSKIVVDFALSPDGTQRWPVRLNALTRDDRRISEVEVISFSKEPHALGLPDAFRLRTFALNEGMKESRPVATWDFTFDTIKTNVRIDGHALTFDPLSVVEIRDEASRTNTVIPK